MRQIRIGKYVGFTDLEDNELGVFLKLQIPMEMVFIDFETKQFSDTRIKLIKRIQDNGIRYIKSTLEEYTYSDILSIIDENWDEQYQLTFLLDTVTLNRNKELLELISAIPKEIYETCVSIGYEKNGDIYTVTFLSEPNGYSNKFIYYNSNETYLVFSKNGPKLVTDDSFVNNILDLIKKFK